MQSIDSKIFVIQNRSEEKHLPIRIAGWTARSLIAFAVPAQAQFGASLSGTVLDPTGASIPQATVTLINPATQEKQFSISNETGAYHFNELAPGNTHSRLQPRDSERVTLRIWSWQPKPREV